MISVELALFLLAAPSSADQLIAQMVASSGAEYVAARSTLLELPRDVVLPVLSARRAHLQWSASSWQADAIVDSAYVWIESPELARKMYALDGLDPAKYRLRRRPDPEVGREFRAMKAASAILFEIELKTLSIYPFRSSDAAQLAKERAALAVALISAAAASHHPAAPHLLKMVLADDRQPLAVRRLAAMGIGQTNALGAFGLIAPIAEDRAADPSLRSGAIAGLGQLHSLASFEVLARLAGTAESGELRAPAIASLGSLANAWVLRRHHLASGEALREKASRALVAILASQDGARLETQLIEAMVMIAHPSLQTELGKIATDATAKAEIRERVQRALSRLALALRRDS